MPLKLTIITPSYNQAQYLEQTIDSVLSQNYPNLEYIIIDGGSKDGSVEINKRYEKHLAYWVSEPDQGQSDAINKGIKKATGDVVNWLNSDDYLEPGSIKIIAEAFQDSQVNCLCAKSNIVDDRGKLIKVSRGTDVYESNLAKTIGWARIDQPETWFRKSVWDSIGLLNTDLHYLMDKEWWVRYLVHFGLNGIRSTDDIIVNFRLHENSKTVSQNEKFQQDHDAIFYFMAASLNKTELTSLLETHCDINIKYLFPDLPKDKYKLLYNSLHYYLLKRADQFYYSKHYNSANAFLGQLDGSVIHKIDFPLYNSLKLKLKIPEPILNLLRK